MILLYTVGASVAAWHRVSAKWELARSTGRRCHLLKFHKKNPPFTRVILGSWQVWPTTSVTDFRSCTYVNAFGVHVRMPTALTARMDTMVRTTPYAL